MNKRGLSETDICDRFITPALRQAGWLPERILREHSFPDGRIIVRSSLVSRGRRKRADDLLVHEGVPVEAASILIPTPRRTTPHRRQGGRTEGPLRPAGAAAPPGRSAAPALAGGAAGGVLEGAGGSFGGHACMIIPTLDQTVQPLLPAPGGH